MPPSDEDVRRRRQRLVRHALADSKYDLDEGAGGGRARMTTPRTMEVRVDTDREAYRIAEAVGKSLSSSVSPSNSSNATVQMPKTANPKSVKLNVRTSKSFKDQAQRAAKHEGENFSEFVRIAIAERKTRLETERKMRSGGGDEG